MRALEDALMIIIRCCFIGLSPIFQDIILSKNSYTFKICSKICIQLLYDRHAKLDDRYPVNHLYTTCRSEHATVVLCRNIRTTCVT
jgi:hypothetical protein